MDESLKIKNDEAGKFDRRYCIICQKKNIKGLISTANGRSKIMEAAQIRDNLCLFQSHFQKLIS